MLLIGILVAASVGAQSHASSADPIARSNGGELQCYGPNVKKKTCQSIASYRRIGPGMYLNKALLPLGDEVTLETQSQVVIKGEAVCGSITRQEVLAGTLRAGNKAIRAEEAKPVLERVADTMSPFFEKEICTRYEASGNAFNAKASIDGVDRPDPKMIVKRITPSDGYTVAQTRQAYRTVIPASTPQLETKWMQSAEGGKAGGYGFSWAETPYGIYILAVAPGSRAEAAGLRSGQQVVEVNGRSTVGMPKNQFAALIHSETTTGFALKFHDGSTVRLPPLRRRS